MDFLRIIERILKNFKHKHWSFTLIGLILYTISFSQTLHLTGKIISEMGEPISGASIVEVKTKKGTISSANGFFSINVQLGSSLQISAVGFQDKDLTPKVSGDTLISLVDDQSTIGEVVVTGVGTATSKKSLGISVEVISSDRLPSVPSASIDQALVGKISGVQISSTSGNPGDATNILFRGINTVQGGTKPLILVDGLEVRATDFNSLDVCNVDRIEVVKGAASSTLYGAQGANGVIQIFTKKGKQGKPAINFATSFSINEYINSGNVHKAKLHPFLTDANGNLINSSGGLLGYDSIGNLPGISYRYGGAARSGIWDPRNNANQPYVGNIHYYDQFKQVFQTGSTLNNMINFSGGSEKNDYAIAVSNSHTVSPVLKNGYLDRSNLTANLGWEVFKGFRIRSVSQLIYTKNTLAPTLGGPGGDGFGQGNSQSNVGLILGFLNTSPFFDLGFKTQDVPKIYGFTNTPGSYAIHMLGGNYLSGNSTNPLYAQKYCSGLDNKVDVVQSFDADYKVNRFLELDAKYGLNFRTENALWTFYNQSANPSAQYFNGYITYSKNSDITGGLDNFQYNTTFQNFLASATFKLDFNKEFHSKLPILTTTKVAFDHRKNKYTELDTYGHTLPLAPPINFLSTASQGVMDNFTVPFITFGYLVDQTVDIGDYGGIEAGFRSDYSSAFGGGSSPFTFPHINAHLLPSAFNFWKRNLPGFPLLKIRAAYGEAGTQPGPFQRYPGLNQSDISTILVYSFPTTISNPDLKVEVTKELELGTDFSLKQSERSWFNAFTGGFTYWKRSSENVIFTVSVPPTLGATGQLTNAIDMSSSGYECSLNFSILRTKNASWDFAVNFNHQESLINSIKGGADIILSSSSGIAAIILSPGVPIGQLYGHKTITDVNQTDPNGNLYIPKANAGNYAKVNGALVDTATKQIQFTPDKYSLGNPNPKFNTSFINTFQYKFFTLSFHFDWVYGSHLYNQTKEWMSRDGIGGDFEKTVNINGQTGAWSAYWSSPFYNVLGSTHGADNNGTRDYYYENASFLRLRNLSIAFELSRIKGLRHFKHLQLMLSGRNLLTVTKYTGFDPELSSGGINSAFDRGVDNNTIPNLKSFQIGLSCSF